MFIYICILTNRIIIIIIIVIVDKIVHIILMNVIMLNKIYSIKTVVGCNILLFGIIHQLLLFFIFLKLKMHALI